MWKKGEKIVNKVNSVIVDDMRIFNPTTEQIKDDGWEEYALIKEQHEPTQEEIKQMREAEYSMRSDKLFIASQHYAAIGETDKAEEFRNKWLEEIGKIKNEYPYKK